MADRRARGHWKRWLATVLIGTALALIGGPFIYIHFVEGKAPAPLSLKSPSASSAPTGSAGPGLASSTTRGSWKVSTGSVVGYRVKEVLLGQSNVAVGRTSAIIGSIQIKGTKVTAASFTVDMTTVTSDRSQRDNQFNGRIMETALYPTATFTLTQPIDLGSIPAAGVERTFQATGSLTLHGVTRTITFQITGRYTGSIVQVAGSVPISFADWNISNPSFGPVTTEDHGALEFALTFSRA